MEFNLSKLQNIKNCNKSSLKLPTKMSEEMAELIGAHFGDGCLCLAKNHTYSIAYCGNLIKDKEYFDYLLKLILRNYNLRFKKSICSKKSSLVIRTYSKKLFYFYKLCLQIPSGAKNNLKIPNYIKKNKIYLKFFLRGLFDTDGCVTLQRYGKYEYTLVKICTKCKSFAEEIKKSLNFLGIPSFITIKRNWNKEYYDIVIRHNNAKKFFEIIGSSNKRNIISFNKYN